MNKSSLGVLALIAGTQLSGCAQMPVFGNTRDYQKTPTQVAEEERARVAAELDKELRLKQEAELKAIVDASKILTELCLLNKLPELKPGPAVALFPCDPKTSFNK